MERAIAVARQAGPEPGRTDPTPKVGVVIAADNEILTEAYRGEPPHPPGAHAEFIALGKIPDRDLGDAEVFTTLEPCSKRNPPKHPCAKRLIDRGASTVYIGSYDPNPIIFRAGWRMLRDAGVLLKDFPADLRVEIEADNRAFPDRFQVAEGDAGEIRFDWSRNDGALPIKTSAGEFQTGWSTNGADSVHAYGRGPTSIAFARHVVEFDEIDDPGSFPFNSHAATPPPATGDVVIFKSGEDYLLVRVLELHAGPRWGADRFELRAAYELRRGK
jgi:diaminohydroxyphosphoribosylaminopyrimidine deaminase / 5-amino-6-(5-phosphoribosylamino)uracil reductase